MDSNCNKWRKDYWNCMIYSYHIVRKRWDKIFNKSTNNNSIWTLFQVFMGVMVGTMSLGHAAPNLEYISSARGAAAAVFGIIDLVSINLIYKSDFHGTQTKPRLECPGSLKYSLNLSLWFWWRIIGRSMQMRHRRFILYKQDLSLMKENFFYYHISNVL